MSDDKLSKITVYKLKINNLEDLNFTRYALVKDDIFKISENQLPFKLFFLNQHIEKADWYSFFSKLGINIDDQQIPRKLVSGYICVVQINASFYGITGGIGHTELKKKCKIEPRFGIDIAEKILSIPEIKGLVQKDTSGIVTFLDRVFRGPYNPNGDINNLKRVLTHVRGKISKDKEFYHTIGKSINASDALSVNGSKDINDLMSFVIKVDELYCTQEKNISIPQLEHINKKTNPDLLEILELQLIEYICAYTSESSTLFLDNEDIGYLPDRVIKYEVIHNRNSQECDCYEDVFESVKNILLSFVSIEDKKFSLKRIHLRVHFDNDNIEKREFLYFICGDIHYNNEIYFINNRLWYKASDEFINRVNLEINNIEFISPEYLNLLKWDTSKYSGRNAEYIYNSDHAKYICLDHRLVKISSERGGIEFCDLLGESNNDLLVIHVKKAHGAALRALFAQGFVSAKFYDEDQEFKNKIHTADLKKEGPELTDQEKTFLNFLGTKNKRNFKIIYAIFDDSPSHTIPVDAKTTLDNFAGTLTAFAKVDLLDRINVIRSMGYNVGITRIKSGSGE